MEKILIYLMHGSQEEREKTNANATYDAIGSSAMKWKVLEHPSCVVALDYGKKRKLEQHQRTCSRWPGRLEPSTLLQIVRFRSDWVTLMTCHDDNWWFMPKHIQTNVEKQTPTVLPRQWTRVFVYFWMVQTRSIFSSLLKTSHSRKMRCLSRK